MDIILLQDIKNLGRAGDIKSVKSGYARNFLIPQGLAKLATKEAVNSAEKQKVESSERIEELRRTLEQIQYDTNQLPLAFKLKTGKKDEIFGSVRADEIKAEILRRYPATGNGNLYPVNNKLPEATAARLRRAIINGVEVKKDHIKELGKRTVPIDLGEGITGEIMIDIEPENK